MPDTYDVVAQNPSTEFLGGTSTRDVMTVAYVTKPSGIYLEYDIPEKVYTPKLVRDYGIGLSGTTEAIMKLPGIVDMTWVQDVTPGGQLQPGFIVYVESSSGLSTGTVKVPWGKFAPELVEPMVNKLVAQLNASES